MHAVKEDVFNANGELELARGAVISDDEATERGLVEKPAPATNATTALATPAQLRKTTPIPDEKSGRLSGRSAPFRRSKAN